MLDVDIPALAARLPAAPLTRFAPAPTGWLHLGHVLNARYVWETARALGGRVLLRIEDHDRIRSKPALEAGILDDLDWLGFHPDIFPTPAFRGRPCDGRQSDRDLVYREAVAHLQSEGLVYGCDCSRGALAATSVSVSNELHYAGRCRGRGLPLTDGIGWRVRMDPGVETFDDARVGR